MELEPGRAAFRHPLVRDAIYEDVPWLRRRSLHRELAEALEARDGGQAEVAAHWLAARDGARALDSLLRAVDELAAVHAYRDAARLGRQALDLWPEGERGAERIAVLERHARFSELAGELSEAARAQREVVAARHSESAGRALADAERRLAAIYELQGDRARALSARRVAADAFAANGLPGEAAAERLIAAGYLQSAGNYSEAVELARRAGEEAGRAERADLRARVLALEGVARVKGGEFDDGMETIRAGLSLALEHELTLEAAEVYQRLGTAHEIAGDYAGARDALATALGFCEASGASGMEHACLSCMAYVLRELGDWERAIELSGELRFPGASPDTTLVADGILGSIHAFRGEWSAARPLLVQCLDTASRLDVVSMSVDSAAALAWLEEHEGDSTTPTRTAASCSSAGNAARITTTRSRDFAGRRASSRVTARSARRAPAPRRCRASPPARDTRTPWRRSRTHSARRRSPRGMRTPPRSSSAGPPSCTRASRSRSSERRSSCARAWRSPRPASANPRPSGSRTRTSRRADSAPRRWPPVRPTRSRSSASRSSSGSGDVRRPSTRTPGSAAASSR